MRGNGKTGCERLDCLHRTHTSFYNLNRQIDNPFLTGVSAPDAFKISSFLRPNRTANLGAPAALIAGAVLVTLSETRESMQPKKSEKRWIRLAKQWFRFLIVSDDDEYTPMILGMRHEEEYLSLIQ